MVKPVSFGGLAVPFRALSKPIGALNVGILYLLRIHDEIRVQRCVAGVVIQPLVSRYCTVPIRP